MVVNSNDEEAFKRIINFPARGIGQTTLDRLIIKANQSGKSIFQLLENIHEIEIKLNSNTKSKLYDFYTMIESFKILNKTSNAFELTDHICRKTGLINEFKKDGSPEGISRMENIEELLNGIKDFVEGQLELVDSTGELSEFLEDVALATDLDNEEDKNSNKVSLMTIHLAKGLEFPFVYIVGLEEDLFPSAMSVNTRTDLEEERRLFYVAVTRAEKQVYLTYSLSRYRWGKLIDSEPSRFIEEINDEYLEINTPKEEKRFNPMIDANIFGDVKPNQIRFNKKKYTTTKPLNNKPRVPKNLKKIINSSKTVNLFDSKLTVGNIINHQRFGNGEVLRIEGKGADLKAEIKFNSVGIKKLLLRFAKLEILS
jgi:DNA helicase-2/ATP-dependent DNA helicase PcrA